MVKIKKPNWDQCKKTDGLIQDVSHGQKLITIRHLEIGMTVDSLYEGVSVCTKIETLLTDKGIEGTLIRIDSPDGETVGDLALGDKVFVPLEYICFRYKS